MTLSICHMRIHDRHSSPLVRTARCLLAVLCLLLAAWVLPWLYRFATAGKQDTPFALYSHITGGFAFAGRSGGQARYYGADGQEFTESAFDSILPFFYFRQLTADGRFPDSISGVAVTPHDVQRSNFTFRTTPQECNRKGVPLYPLLESRSGRVDLTMPDDVFRMVSVMGGGVGGSGCLCGALNGACHILGLLVGRNTPEEKTKAEIYAPVKEFYQLWMGKFHASCCRVLKSPANGGPVSCPELMVGTAELLAAFIEEKGLLKK